MLPDFNLSDKDDLQYISSRLSVRVDVDDVVYNLISEISSDDEVNDGDNSLEQYLVSDYQGMARTKNTGRKTSPLKNPFISAGGLPIARQPQNSPRCGDPAPVPMPNGGRKPPHLSGLPSLGSSNDDIGSGGSNRSKRSRSEDEDGLSPPGKKAKTSRNIIPSKNLQRIRPLKKSNMKELVTAWNRSARIGKVSETSRGWLRKTTKW